MAASNPTRNRQAKAPPRRRRGCSAHAGNREGAHAPRLSSRRAPAANQRSDRIDVTITVTPLENHETNPLRAQQLAVIVELLQCAATEALQAAVATGLDTSPGSR